MRYKTKISVGLLAVVILITLVICRRGQQAANMATDKEAYEIKRFYRMLLQKQFVFNSTKSIAFGNRNFDGKCPWYDVEYTGEMLDCSVPCMLTPDREMADGVMFSAQRLDFKRNFLANPELHHHPHQLWMIYSSEAQVSLSYTVTPGELQQMGDLFNYVGIFHEHIYDRNLGHYGYARQLTSREKLVTKGIGYSKHLKTKSGLAVGIISACDQSSGRIGYIKSMTEHIKAAGKTIHVYGRCLDGKRCEQKYDPATCTWDALGKRYKFYLAFENSRCRGYITEKFWYNSLAHDMIPIVNGGLSRADYDAVAPTHSFIHTDDFDNPEDLVKYLLYLDNNSTAYNEYFKWRETHVNVQTNLLPNVPCPENPGACKVSPYCGFCKFLHDQSDHPKTDTIDLFEALSVERNCRSPWGA